MIFALDVALKATLVCLLAWGLHAVAGRRLLVRSALWNACLVGLLALPFSAASPRLRISCLPAASAPVSTSVPEPTRGVLPPEVLPTPVTLSPAPLPPAPASRPWSLPGWRSWVLAAYLAIAGALGLRLACGLVAVARLRRSARPIEAGPWAESLARWGDRLGMRRRVRLGTSARVGVPVALGWARPMIVLPEGLAESAAPAAVDAVTLHELAHLRRGDYAWNLVLRLVQAVYWPHPFAWWIGRTIAGVREQACDDLCVYWMEDAMSYRTTLLDVAALMARGPGEALGLAMARGSTLGRRLRRLERSKGSARCLLRWPARASIALAVIAAFVAAGSVRLARTASAQAAAPRPNQEAKEDPAAPAADAPPGAAPKGGAGTPVRAARVVRGDLPMVIVLPATLEANDAVALHARIAGEVTGEGLASVGDRVKKGQVLAILDAPELRRDAARLSREQRQAEARARQAAVAVKVADAALAAAEAKIEEAKAELARSAAAAAFRKKEDERLRALSRANAVGQAQIDENADQLNAAESAQAGAAARVKSAEAARLQASAEREGAVIGRDTTNSELNFLVTELRRMGDLESSTRIVAPIDGVVTRRNVNVGSLVRPGGEGPPLFLLASRDRLRGVTAVPENLALRVDPGDSVKLQLSAGGKPIASEIARVAYDLDPGTKTLRVEFDVPNVDGKLRPGMSGSATILLEIHHNVLSIPNFIGPKGWCVVDGKAKEVSFRSVENGMGRREVEQNGALKEGDVVVTGVIGKPFSELHFNLEEGETVRVAPDEVAPNPLP